MDKELAKALSVVECIEGEYVADGGTYEGLKEHQPYVDAVEAYNVIAQSLGKETFSYL